MTPELSNNNFLNNDSIRSSHLKLKEFINSHDWSFTQSYQVEDSHRPYSKRLLLENDFIEIVLIKWKYQIPCTPHDHGNSWGYVKILNGSLENTSYSIKNDSLYTKKNQVTSHGKEELLYIPKNYIHSIESTNKQTTTLHFYVTPIKNMKIYNFEEKKGYIVSSDSGAWLPLEPHQILKEFPINIL